MAAINAKSIASVHSLAQDLARLCSSEFCFFDRFDVRRDDRFATIVSDFRY